VRSLSVFLASLEEYDGVKQTPLTVKRKHSV